MGHGTGVAVLTENTQSLQALIVPLFQPDQTLITGPCNFERVINVLIGFNRIEGIADFLGRQFLSQQFRINREPGMALIP